MSFSSKMMWAIVAVAFVSVACAAPRVKRSEFETEVSTSNLEVGSHRKEEFVHPNHSVEEASKPEEEEKVVATVTSEVSTEHAAEIESDHKDFDKHNAETKLEKHHENEKELAADLTGYTSTAHHA